MSNWHCGGLGEEPHVDFFFHLFSGFWDGYDGCGLRFASSKSCVEGSHWDMAHSMPIPPYLKSKTRMTS